MTIPHFRTPARDGENVEQISKQGISLRGAGFGCAYALVVLLLGGSSGPGLAIFSGLGGALVGAVSDCIIAVLTLGIGQLTRIRRDLEKAIAAVIAGT